MLSVAKGVHDFRSQTRRSASTFPNLPKSIWKRVRSNDLGAIEYPSKKSPRDDLSCPCGSCKCNTSIALGLPSSSASVCKEALFVSLMAGSKASNAELTIALWCWPPTSCVNGKFESRPSAILWSEPWKSKLGCVISVFLSKKFGELRLPWFRTACVTGFLQDSCASRAWRNRCHLAQQYAPGSARQSQW